MPQDLPGAGFRGAPPRPAGRRAIRDPGAAAPLSSLAGGLLESAGVHSKEKRMSRVDWYYHRNG